MSFPSKCESISNQILADSFEPATYVSLSYNEVPLGGGGHSHMLVDIKCLSIDPLFYADLTPNDPPSFFSPHPMTPFFPLLYQILHTNCKFSHAFWEIYKFCGNSNIRFANFGLKLHFCTLNDSHFWESTSKKILFFFAPTPNDPLFSVKSYTKCPLLSFSGRHLYITFIFRSPPGTAVASASWSTLRVLCSYCDRSYLALQ